MNHFPVIHVEVSETQSVCTFKNATIVGFQPRVGCTMTIVTNLTKTFPRYGEGIKTTCGASNSKIKVAELAKSFGP